MIIVTGASRGLGANITQNLNKKGFDTFGIARNITDNNLVQASCDISNYDEVKLLSKEIKKKKIPIEGIINAAGIASMNLAITTPKKMTENIIKTNLLGTIFCCQLFSPLMMRNKKGLILNFSTVAVGLGLKGESIYVASKAGIEGFTRSFAREMADFNINVNCIAPGPIETDLIRGISDTQVNDIIKRQILQKKYSPNDVYNLVELLLSKNAKTLSGQVFYVGGL